MITVKRLIEMLEEEDPNKVIIMSSDPEGNSFAPFHEFSHQSYDEDNSEVGLEKLTPSLAQMGYTKEDVKENGLPCLVFWPR